MVITLTIKNIFKIDILVYFFALTAVFTAAFKEFIIIFYLVIIHELGHSLVAYILGIKIEEIRIYPLGGISKFAMPLNTSPIKELLILIAGPLFQEFAYLFLVLIIPAIKDLISVYHYSILLFNLAPIYPLDGGKLLAIIMESFYPYKKSLVITITISYIVLIVLPIATRTTNLNILFTIVFLLVLITKEKVKIDYYYNKFLLERYLYKYNFKDTKIITNINDFYRNKKHLIKDENNYYFEHDYLIKKYQKRTEKC